MRQQPARTRWQYLLVFATILAAGAGAIWVMPQRNAGGLERLRGSIPRGQAIAVREGNLYVEEVSPTSAAAYRIHRVPVTGGKSVVRLSLTAPQPFAAWFFPAEDALYLVKIQQTGKVVAKPQTRSQAPSLGDFLLGTPRPGERRRVISDPVRNRTLQAYRVAWSGGALQPVPLPLLRPGPIRVEAVTASGVYLSRQDGYGHVEVLNRAGRRDEYPANVELLYLSFGGEAPVTLARNFTALGRISVHSNTVCWNQPPLYANGVTLANTDHPQTGTSLERNESVCRSFGKVALPDAGYSDVAACQGGECWAVPSALTASQSGHQPRLMGQEKLHVVEPALRRSEGDEIRYEWIRSIQNRIYVLCEAPDLENTTPSSGVTRHYLVRMYPEFAGTARFWGKPVALPRLSYNFVTDTDYLYFLHEEEVQSLGLAIQDLFSPNAMARRENVLYRVPLP